jgi:hypothetical protein
MYTDRADRDGDLDSRSVSAVPTDLQAFAPKWPLEACTKSDPPGAEQVERWECDLDNSTQLYLIRYEIADGRNAKWRECKSLRPGSGTTADWTNGTAAAPGGALGRYVEFEVAPRKGEWHEAIWWDNGPGNKSSSFGLLLSTSSTPNAQQALDRLRLLWKEKGYTPPQ